MSQYKVIVLDIDGTLVNSKKEISDSTKQTLLKLQEAGIVVVLASGRPLFGIESLAKELQLDKYGGFILAYNGAQIINCATREVVVSINFPNELIATVYEQANDSSLAILSYNDTHIITEHQHAENDYVQKEALLNCAKVKYVDSFVKEVPYLVPKCLIVGPVEELEPLEQLMNTGLNQHINIFRSEPFFLELMPKGVDKANSLAKLLAHLGYEREEMIACGDGFNDLSMIQYAGLGVAMANAQQVVKDAADFITLSNDDDGVVHVINRFFMPL
jgi:Cof subfamily protein (haloacid dehalogenase superfamily)